MSIALSSLTFIMDMNTVLLISVLCLMPHRVRQTTYSVLYNSVLRHKCAAKHHVYDVVFAVHKESAGRRSNNVYV
jgi:hypothetical protein